MRFFKQKARLSDTCNEFYDKYILSPEIAGISLIESYFDSVREALIEVDENCENIDSHNFTYQMTSLYFEVYGLAWLHELGDKYTANQTAFTKNYLDNKDMPDVWDEMEHYNRAISRSCTYGVPLDTQAGKLFLAELDKKRLDKFGTWSNQGIDQKCSARAANRLFSEKPWKDNVTPSFLMMAVCNRLGLEIGEEAQQRLFAIIHGLYDGSKQSLAGISVVM